MMLKLILVVFLIGFVSAVDVEMDCPDEIFAGESFECEVEVDDGDGRYDLKVEVDEERDSVLRIWNGVDWQSGYYYVKDFVRKSEDVRLMILEEGRFGVVVKLRDGEWREEFDVGKIRVESARDDYSEPEGENVEGETLNTDGTDFTDFEEGSAGIISLDEGGVIVLGGNEIGVDVAADGTRDDEWDYISKDGMVVDWLPYGFGLFMIFLVGVFALDKRNDCV